MSDVALALRQARADLRVFARDPTALFFTVLLPLLFLLVLAAVFGDGEVGSRGVSQVAYYVPGILALGVVSTTFVNLSISLTEARESGVLKRVRGTPLPAWAFIGGRVMQALVLMALTTLLIAGIGWAAFGVPPPTSALPGAVLALAVGTFAFCCLGVALTAVIPSEEAAPAVANAIVLPLYFISGVFFPVDDAPGWLVTLADLFPVRHLAEAMLVAWDPDATAPGIAWGHLTVVAVWGVAGLVVAMRFFRWTPRGSA